MEANELRIGNLIKSGEKIITVKNINLEGINFDFCCEQNAYEYSEIEPITLSEDLLEKTNLEKKEGVAEHIQYGEVPYKLFMTDKLLISKNGSDFSVDLRVYNGACQIAHMCNIKYLHQLQNLYFALTGNEIEINL